MSTRFYPRFVKGNPQLRVFLPDWKIIMVKPKVAMPDNIVTFKTDPRMTDWDIKNYLEKIYKVKVAGIRSWICAGPLVQSSKGLGKDDDYKLAHVTLPLGQKFTWPDLFPEEKEKEILSDYQKMSEALNQNRKVDPNKNNLPTWLM